MGNGSPLTKRVFVRRLRRLSHETLVAFVADLWTLEGWETTVTDGCVIARLDDDERYLSVYRERRFRSDETQSCGSSVDTVVTTGGSDGTAATAAATWDADLVTADDLYNRLMYAVDRTAAKGLLWDYFASGAEMTTGLSGTTGNIVRQAGAIIIAAGIVAAFAGGAGGVIFGIVNYNVTLDGEGVSTSQTTIGVDGAGQTNSISADSTTVKPITRHTPANNDISSLSDVGAPTWANQPCESELRERIHSRPLPEVVEHFREEYCTPSLSGPDTQ